MSPIAENEIFKGLNKEQAAAVRHTKGPLLVIAGAGTGKTTVIIRRIAHLIASKAARPSEILALTFTDKAANEMESRVDAMVPYGYIDVAISTFHSFGDRILRDYALDLGMRPDYKVLSYADQIVFFTENIDKFPLKHYRSLANPTKHIEALIAAVSRAMDEDVAAEEYVAWAKKKGKRCRVKGEREEIERQLEVALVYKKYQELKLKKGFVDFGDQVGLVLKLFRGNPRILKTYQDRYKFIMIDEFQDTNYAQFELIKLLAGEDPNLVVVGDDDQCLPSRTMIETKRGKKRIDRIKEGEEVITAVGKGHLSYSKVNKVMKKNKTCRLITFKTEKGKEITVTSNHKMFCFTPAVAKDRSIFYAYLMRRNDLGWRIGITSDLASRLRLERSADRIIGIRGFKSQDEAKYHEVLWSLKYGIPTVCFQERKGLAIRKESLVNLYKDINVDLNVVRLAHDLDIDLDAHHFCLSGVKRGKISRIKINLEMCCRRHRAKNKKGVILKNPLVSHRLCLETSDGAIEKILNEHRVPYTKGKKGIRIRFLNRDLRQIGGVAQKLRFLTGGIIEAKFNLGTSNRQYKPALVMPASNVLLGSYLPVVIDKEVIYDRVIDLRSVERNEYVYDLDIERTHNFVADSVVVHNSIYKFRGAAISNILNFGKVYKKTGRIVLRENFRSTQLVLDAAYRLIRHNDPDRLEVRAGIDKRLVAERGAGSVKVEHKHFDRVAAEADWVAKRISERVSSGGYKLRDFAILIRANADAEPFRQSLNMLSLPYSFSGGGGLYIYPEVKLAVSFLKVIGDLADSVALHHLSLSEIYRLDPLDLQKIDTFARRRNYTIHFVFSHIDECKVKGSEFFVLSDVKESSLDLIKKIMDDVGHYLDFAKNHSTGEVLYHFLKRSGYLGTLAADESEENDRRLKNLAAFFERVRRFREIVEEDKVSEFVKYLNIMKEAGENPEAAQPDPEMDAVNIMTVHKAKGLEFPVVFLCGLVAEKFPVRVRREAISLPDGLIKEEIPLEDQDLKEERRLFYVGMTRAKDELYLTSSIDYGGKRERKISQFVLEALDLPKADIKTVRTRAIDQIELFAPQEMSFPPVKKIKADEIIPLSYYPIDDYITCPLKYKYIHVINVPLLPSHFLMYGAAIHKAVQAYFSARRAGHKPSKNDLLLIFKHNWSAEGFISRKHEEERFKAGEAALKRFYKEQQRSKAKIRFVEEEFKFVRDNIQIKGRFDLVLEEKRSKVKGQGSRISIVDFKTSEVKDRETADKKTRESVQLSIYALAWLERFGELPDRVQLYFIDSGVIGSAGKNEKDLEKAWEKIRKVADSIRSADFRATPAAFKCGYCPYNEICPSSAV